MFHLSFSYFYYFKLCPELSFTGSLQEYTYLCNLISSFIAASFAWKRSHLLKNTFIYPPPLPPIYSGCDLKKYLVFSFCKDDEILALHNDDMTSDLMQNMQICNSVLQESKVISIRASFVSLTTLTYSIINGYSFLSESISMRKIDWVLLVKKNVFKCTIKTRVFM